MKKQYYFITKGIMIPTDKGHMIVNSYDSGIVCLTEFDYAFHEVGNRKLSIEDIERILYDMFGLDFNVIWKENFTRS